MSLKLKTIFMSTSDIALSCLSFLHESIDIDLLEVISMPDRKKGRGQKQHSPPIIEQAKILNIPYRQTENINDPEFKKDYLDKSIDLIIVFSFSQFLSKFWLNLPRFGAFNIHTSLLPRYRGAAPIQYALLNRDKTTGVTIQKMVSKMDQGPIALQSHVDIDLFNDSYLSLSKKLEDISLLLLSELIQKIKNNKLILTEQDHSKACYAPIIDKSMGRIYFNKENFNSITSKLKAFEVFPSLYCFLNKKRLKILMISKVEYSLRPGEVKVIDNALCVGLIDQTIRLNKIALEGKGAKSDEDFLRGHRGELVIE